MSVIDETLNNNIIAHAVIEVGKFVGVDGFTEQTARIFFDCLVAVIGKYLNDHPCRSWHLNKYHVYKKRNEKYNLFSVQIYRQDEYIKTPTDLYDYYLKGGKDKREFLRLVETFAKELLMQSMIDEEENNTIITKLSKMKKITEHKSGVQRKKRKLRAKRKRLKNKERKDSS